MKKDLPNYYASRGDIVIHSIPPLSYWKCHSAVAFGNFQYPYWSFMVQNLWPKTVVGTSAQFQQNLTYLTGKLIWCTLGSSAPWTPARVPWVNWCALGRWMTLTYLEHSQINIYSMLAKTKITSQCMYPLPLLLLTDLG